MSVRTNQRRATASAKRPRAMNRPAAYARAPKTASRDCLGNCENRAAPARTTTATSTPLSNRSARLGARQRYAARKHAAINSGEHARHGIQLAERPASDEHEVHECCQRAHRRSPPHAWDGSVPRASDHRDSLRALPLSCRTACPRRYRGRDRAGVVLIGCPITLPREYPSK